MNHTFYMFYCAYALANIFTSGKAGLVQESCTSCSNQSMCSQQ
jgi:hypothetical protein